MTTGNPLGVPLRALTLGRALADLGRVREDEGPNLSAEIRAYFAALEPAVIISDDAETGYPWCAAAVQYWSDQAARMHGLRNPLDVVAHEALVADYAAAGDERGWIRPSEAADPGCLVVFRFAGQRWDHIGLVAEPPRRDGDRMIVSSIDGNSNTGEDRDRVVRKTRRVQPDRALFLLWDEGLRWYPPVLSEHPSRTRTT